MPDTERAAIETTVRKYIDGIAVTNPELVAEAFHPAAVMTRVTEAGLESIPNCGAAIASFMKAVPPTSEHSPDFNGHIVDVRVHGTLADVEVAENQLQGVDMKTFFQLHKIGNDWLILSKATWAPSA